MGPLADDLNETLARRIAALLEGADATLRDEAERLRQEIVDLAHMLDDVFTERLAGQEQREAD